jgi:hypothetical protein
MRFIHSFKALIVVTIVALTLFAQQGTAWAGVSWDRQADGPVGVGSR